LRNRVSCLPTTLSLISQENVNERNISGLMQEDELSMVKGEKLHIINKFPDEWLLVQNTAVHAKINTNTRFLRQF
jgi:hypothetical protein